MGEGSTGVVPQGGAVSFFRFAELALLLEQRAQRTETLDKVGPQFQGAAKLGQGLVEPALVLQHAAEEEMHVGVVRP